MIDARVIEVRRQAIAQRAQAVDDLEALNESIALFDSVAEAQDTVDMFRRRRESLRRWLHDLDGFLAASFRP